jgi:hypothetical protein
VEDRSGSDPAPGLTERIRSDERKPGAKGPV